MKNDDSMHLITSEAEQRINPVEAQKMVKTVYETYNLETADGVVHTVTTEPERTCVGYITRGQLQVAASGEVFIAASRRWHIVGVEYIHFKSLAIALDALIDQYVDQRALRSVTEKLRRNDGLVHVFRRLHYRYMSEDVRIFKQVVSNERHTLLEEFLNRTHAVRAHY